MQTSINKKKGGIFFVIAPVLLMMLALLFRSYDFKSGKFSFSNSTKFSPIELSELADQYSFNSMAGECMAKKFVKFKDDNAGTTNFDDSSCFYYFGNKLSPDKRRKYLKDVDARIENMKESLSPVADLMGFRYRIKSKKAYTDFIASLSSSSVDTFEEIKSYCNGQNYFVVNHTIFIDSNYIDRLQGYVIYIFPALTGKAAYSIVYNKGALNASFIRVLDSSSEEDKPLISNYTDRIKRLKDYKNYYSAEMLVDYVVKYDGLNSPNLVQNINNRLVVIMTGAKILIEAGDKVLYGKEGLNDDEAYQHQYFTGIKKEQNRPIRFQVGNNFYLLNLEKLKKYQDN